MKEVPSLNNLALDLIDTDERREQTVHLLEILLPQIAADIENSLHEQSAKVFYEIFVHLHHPKIRVLLKLKKLEHEFLIHLDSYNSMFVIGSERGGEQAANAQVASNILKSSLLKFKVS
jgi:hypothetical protein